MSPESRAESKAYYFALAKSLPSRILRRYQKLNIYAKIFVWLWILFEIVVVVAIIVITPSRVAQFMYDNAEKLARHPFGWVAATILVASISFPPLHGHTTAVTLCGFAWGLQGILYAGSGTLLGAAVVFIVLRLTFKERLRALSKGNQKWQALETVVSVKGLPLIILIRMSAFPPLVYSNALFASITSVSLWQFLVATCFVFPRLLLLVFIGSRVAALADGEQRNHMDTQTKVINGLLIAGSIIITIIASWLVYTSVQKHIRQLPELPSDVDAMAADALDEFNDSEDAPLLPANV
ncbi:hypothetical protein C8J57DRAFT_1293461 [Mycena rebaudengoi]|nr:hypothetical protein C8J57DRAFT_1293461 [Mycena rebaudengoi]